MGAAKVSALVGIVGRLVSTRVKRGEETTDEVCEVVACQTGGEYGSYRILVATHDGTLLQVGYDDIKLVSPSSAEGPYR